ncbi:bifunctional DNA primase/polymerase [Actibacterium sp.]|uniref:bifunctional DNA primase/polymerase n=1 Tax=Actibacterium sp. TaxID=1872125 RepID=UPI00257ACEF3|nr:bifunctional DNA primase/polymerase [Actibacterium sp.]
MHQKSTESTANLQAAQALASAGLPVFPVGPGKRPLVKWRDRATTNPAQIERWWQKWPEAMPGLPMGQTSKLAVLDLDKRPDKDGLAALREMGLDPDTLSPVRVATPSGGQHIYFRWPEGMGNSAAGLPPGMDVRGEGGFVVAPGAVNGKGTYRLVSGALGEALPDWPDRLQPRRRAVEPGEGEPTGLLLPVILSALSALPNDGDAFASRDAWLRIGMGLHAETGGSDAGREAWHGWSRLWPGYDPDATDAAWDSFAADGGVSGWVIIAEAEARGWSDPSVAELRRLETLDDFTDDDVRLPDAILPEEEASIAALVSGGPVERSGLTFETPADCAAVAPRPYVVKGLLSEGDVAAIVGAPGAGKSLFAPRLGYAVAQGAEAFGRRTKAGRVLYVAAEDHHGMRGRLSALRKQESEAPDFLLVGGVSDLLSKKGDLRALLAAVKTHRPKLVFIDTLAVAFPGLEENAAEGMGRVVAAARSLTKWGAAVVLIHHDTKAGERLPRGHSLLNGALDVSLYLKREGSTVIVEPTKNRNGTTEQALGFRIVTRQVGIDEDGDPIRAAVAEETDAAFAGSASNGLSPSASAAFEIFRQLSGGVHAVADADWRQAVIDSRTVSASENEESRRRAYKRAVEELARSGKVIFSGDYFTEVRSDGEDFTDDDV